jgi:MFS transporter, ACS family, tartrate transporter
MSTPPSLSAVTRKVTLRIVPFMMLLYLVNYVDRANVGYAAPKMESALHLSDAAYGLGAGIFYAGYMICEIPSNLLLHKFGARRWIARILISWGLVSGFTSLIQGAGSFYAVRILLGVAEAGFYPGMIMYLTYWLPRRNRVWAMTIFQLGIPLSNIVFAPISAPIVAMNHVLGMPGWRAVFVIEAIPAIIMGVLTLWLMTGRPADAKWLSTDEKSVLGAALEAEEQAAETGGKHSVKSALLNRKVLGLSAIYFGVETGLVILVFFLPLIIASFQKQYGTTFSATQTGLLTAVPYAAAIPASLLWGWHSRRTGEASWHVAIPMVIGAVSTSVALYMSSPTGAMIAITVTSMCVFSAIPVFWQLPSVFLTGSAAAAAVALINAIGVSSNFVGPYVMGWLRDATGNYRAGMIWIAAFMLMAAVVVVAMRKATTAKFDATVLPADAASLAAAVTTGKEF